MPQQNLSDITRQWQKYFFRTSALFLATGACAALTIHVQYATSFTLGFLSHYAPCWIAAQCTFLHTGASHRHQILLWFFLGEVLKLLSYTGFVLLSLWFFDINITVFFIGMALSIGTFLWVPSLNNRKVENDAQQPDQL